VAIFEKWHADDDHFQLSKSQEIHFDVSNWPPPQSSISMCFTLRLEELTHYEIQDRSEARIRNLKRIQHAQQRKDIVHLNIHYTCCVDQIQRDAIEALVRCDDREWCSFTVKAINGVSDLYSSPNDTLENLFSFFFALHNFQVLNLHSCTWNRGHGLECILKAVPYYEKLSVLRLEGWQLDRVSVTALMESLHCHHWQSISCLSLRSCRFVGDGTFFHIVNGLQHVKGLTTLNVSYCNLGDNDIIPLVAALKDHHKITKVHLGGNFCRSPESVQAIATWIGHPSCQLEDINLRSLWAGFTEEGLLQRLVDMNPVFQALSENRSICRLSLPENYMSDDDMAKLTASLLSPSKKELQFLDVGDNPFNEKGATLLVNLVQRTCSIRAIRFENHFIQYRCSELVKLLVEFNHYHQTLIDKSVKVSLPLWPHALAKVQRLQLDGGLDPLTQQRAASHLFRLLRSATGPHGHELSLQIALHSLQV
jgi:Ran GTPase-activating protein (RanGAP) involved in mRNA processing and transport